MKILLLINGVAGNNFGKRNAYKIIEKLSLQGNEVSVFPILPSEGLESSEIIASHRGEFDAVACCGGDGTLHYVINGLLKNEQRKPILYIPAGTTNDFAKTLGIPPASDKTLNLLENGELLTFDIGRFNDEYFDYVAAFGAFTDVSYSTDQNVKNLLGYSAYLFQSLGTATDALNMKIRMRVESEEYSGEGEFIYGSVSNSYSLAGIRTPLLSEVKLNDGNFEVALVKAPKNAGDLLEILRSVSTGELDDKHIKIYRTKKVSFHFEQEVPWTLDGEFGGSYKDVEIRVVPEAISIYTEKNRS